MSEQKATIAQRAQVETVTGSGWWSLPDILFQPAAAFREIDKNAAWLAPLLAAALLRLVRLFIFYSPSREPPKVVASFLLEAITFALPVLVCSAALVSVLYLVGAGTTFKKVFAVSMHSFFVYTVINVVLGVAIFSLAPDPGSINLQNPALTNPGFLADPTEHLALNYLLSSIDVVSFYNLYLIALGLSIVSRKCSLVKALTVTASLWAAYVALGVGIKFIVG